MSSSEPLEFSARLWLNSGTRRVLGKGRAQLLELIEKTGSITQAAKEMGISYKAAWKLVDLVNSAAQQPLVVRTRGGVGGGETKLTDEGREMLRQFRTYQEEHYRFLARLTARINKPRGKAH